ncbi:MAG: hypothetical protein EKK54_06315 [Neisseriaceae bacterium]|nr:MAG: hypothetical protein EKK54_06315 [Neisseriaceae bacterium]
MNKKLDDKTRQKLITLIPKMEILKNGGYTYKKIIEYIKLEYSIKLPISSPESFLKTFLSPKRYEKYNSSFSNYVILREVSDLSILPCYITKYGCIFTLRELIKDDNLLFINKRNVHLFNDLSSCLIAKRIMRFHDISDDVIMLARESLGLSNSFDQKITPDYISENIMDIFHDFEIEFTKEFIKYKTHKSFTTSF